LLSTTHVVAHLLRECESGLRKALALFAEKATANAHRAKNGDSHANNIRAILEGLHIAETEQVARDWIALAGQDNARGLNSRAHRDALSPPRPLDTEFQEFWQLYQGILDVVLEKFEARYLLTIDALDRLLALRKPTAKDASRLRQNLPNNFVNLHYFFSRLKDPTWLDPLRDEGFFAIPPEPIRHEGEMVSFPFWPVSRYLARVASQVPERVLEVALQVPHTENVRVYEDLADAALAMPPELSVRLIPKLTAGLESPFHLVLPEKLGQLVSHLAQGGKDLEALDLAAEVLAVRSISAPEGSDSTSGRAEGASTGRVGFDLWQYGEILKNYYPVLVGVVGLPAVRLLADLLEAAIKAADGFWLNASADDLSCIWHQAVEQDDRFRDDVRSLLISGLRDAAAQCMPSDGAEALRLLEERDLSVFRRIAIHLRRLWPSVDPNGTALLVGDRERVGNICLWHELFHLLKDLFGDLPWKAQDAYLRVVEEGFDVSAWLASRSSTDETPTPDRIAARVRCWRYRLLVPIAAYLSDPWERRYESYRQEFGEIEHPDYHFYVSSVTAGLTSPKTGDELGAMTVQELVSFLALWKPTDDWESPKPKGLGRLIDAMVAESPRDYADDAMLFVGVEPTYVRALIQGLEKAVGREVAFSWAPVIELCLWAVSQPRVAAERVSIGGDADLGWGPTRRAIVNLVGRGLKEGSAELPYQMRSLIWQVIQGLLDDPDPTPDSETEHTMGDLGPVTVALNSVVKANLLFPKTAKILLPRSNVRLVDYASLSD
jgi:hypothetical protein